MSPAPKCYDVHATQQHGKSQDGRRKANTAIKPNARATHGMAGKRHRFMLMYPHLADGLKPVSPTGPEQLGLPHGLVRG